MTCQVQVCQKSQVGFLLHHHTAIDPFPGDRSRLINPQSNRATTGEEFEAAAVHTEEEEALQEEGRRSWRLRSARLRQEGGSGLVWLQRMFRVKRAVCNHVTHFVDSSSSSCSLSLPPLQHCIHRWCQCNPLTYFHQSK